VNIATYREFKLLFSGEFLINNINIAPIKGKNIIDDKIGKFIKLKLSKLII
tara:strand:- start:349 stop:501 length:153 start_codon:yes stop_codon:yes gene_type:complete